jgi:hypothetical protein
MVNCIKHCVRVRVRQETVVTVTGHSAYFSSICRWVDNSFCCAKKTRRKKEAVQEMYTVLFKETEFNIYLQWVPPYIFFYHR